MPPEIESDDEQASVQEESPASQPPLDDEEPSSQAGGEILFQEDLQKGPRKLFEDHVSVSDISSTMKVSTAEILTQEHTVSQDVAKKQIDKILKVTETVVDKQVKDNRDDQDGIAV